MDKYEELIIEIVEFQTKDIVTTSTSNPDVWTDEDE